MSTSELLGIAAGALELLSLPIYVGTILRGKTRPDRVTWWILSLVSAMVAASYFAAGARQTVWLPASFALCMLIVAVLSLRYGEGAARLSAIDTISLLGALLSAVLWVIVQSPLVALLLLVFTEFIGLIPTIHKAYRRPWTESTLPWAIGSLAAFLNVLAIPQWSFAIALYPFYIFATNLIVTAFLLRKRNV
ncbi:MAG TPA: hypothetical protein VN495_03110 [Candidatus Paceibacterota bacterium]|nr:hypothetical protein [Candidatus Paceibacterota bacterium]